MNWTLLILFVLSSFICRFGIKAQGFRPPAIIGQSPIPIQPENNQLPDFTNILQDPIIQGLDPGLTNGNSLPLLTPTGIDTPIPKPPPVIAPATNVVFDRSSSNSGVSAVSTGVQGAKHTGPHIDFPNEHNNTNPFPIIHVPQPVQDPQSLPNGGVHVDPVGVHGNEGPGPVIHREGQNIEGGTHVDLVGVHGNEGPGPVIHRAGPNPQEGTHVDPVGVHGNEGPGPVIHRAGPTPQGDTHVDPVGVHGNEGPGQVIHRAGQTPQGGTHVDPVGVHGNEGPGPVIHRAGPTPQGGTHVDPVGVHGNEGPGPVIHRAGPTPQGDTHVDPIGVHGNEGPGPVIHRAGQTPQVGTHVDPVGVHGNEGPGPVIHRAGPTPLVGTHVDSVGVHGNEGTGPVIHRPGQSPQGGTHVDPVGVHGNEGPGPVIHRQDTSIQAGTQVDPVGVHGNEGPGLMIHRTDPSSQGGSHVDPVGVHGNEGPGPVIHRADPSTTANTHVDPVGVHGNEGPGIVIHRAVPSAIANTHVDPVGVHGNEGPGPLLHRAGTSPQGNTHVDPVGIHGNEGPGPIIHRTNTIGVLEDPTPVLHTSVPDPEGAVHVGAVGVGMGPVMHRVSPTLQEGVPVDPVGVIGNERPVQGLPSPGLNQQGGVYVDSSGIHNTGGRRPVLQMAVEPPHRGTYVDSVGALDNVNPLGMQGTEGPGPLFPRLGPNRQESMPVGTIGVNGNEDLRPELYGPSVSTQELSVGVPGIDITSSRPYVGAHGYAGLGPMLHEAGSQPYDGIHKDPAGLHGSGQVLLKPHEQIPSGEIHFGPVGAIKRPAFIIHRSGTHGIVDIPVHPVRPLDRFHRPIVEKGILNEPLTDFGPPASVPSPVKPKSATPLVNLVKSVANRIRGSAINTHGKHVKPVSLQDPNLLADQPNTPAKPIITKPIVKKTITIVKLPPHHVHPLDVLRSKAQQRIGAMMSGLIRSQV